MQVFELLGMFSFTIGSTFHQIDSYLHAHFVTVSRTYTVDLDSFVDTCVKLRFSLFNHLLYKLRRNKKKVVSTYLDFDKFEDSFLKSCTTPSPGQC